jgi:hypothetical protein
MMQAHLSGQKIERFKPLPTNANYLISDRGRVFSKRSGRFLGSRKDRYGYQRFSFRVNGKPKETYIHRAVCLTFFGEPKPGQTDVNHKDCNIENNSVENLEWCTRSHNCKHARANGLIIAPRGTRHSKSKLTNEQAESIRAEYIPRKMSLRMLARKYSVHASIIERIVKGRAY